MPEDEKRNTSIGGARATETERNAWDKAMAIYLEFLKKKLGLPKITAADVEIGMYNRFSELVLKNQIPDWPFDYVLTKKGKRPGS